MVRGFTAAVYPAQLCCQVSPSYVCVFMLAVNSVVPIYALTAFIGTALHFCDHEHINSRMTWFLQSVAFIKIHYLLISTTYILHTYSYLSLHLTSCTWTCTVKIYGPRPTTELVAKTLILSSTSPRSQHVTTRPASKQCDLTTHAQQHFQYMYH